MQQESLFPYGSLCALERGPYPLCASQQFKREHESLLKEQTDQFHQDILDFEHRYRRQYNENIRGVNSLGII